MVGGAGLARRGPAAGVSERGVGLLTLPEALGSARVAAAPAPRLDLGRGQGPLDLGLARGRRPRLGRAPAGAAPAARTGRAPPGAGRGAAGHPRAPGLPGERLGLPRQAPPGGRLPVQACDQSRRGDARGLRLRPPTPGAAHAQPGTRPQPRPAAGALAARAIHHDQSPHPHLGVPAADRGRPGAPRPQALRGPRRARRRGPRADPRRRGVARRGDRQRRLRSTASASRSARPTWASSSPGSSA